MRILSVTESYAPFLEFGGPPVKVKALARGLAKRGHEVTVVTADWGLEKRRAELEGSQPERSPLGWSHTEGGITAVYLPTWLKYRSLTWNPALKRFSRERLAEFDVAHIYGLYDFMGPSVAARCAKLKIPYVLEPIGMYAPIVRSLALKRVYHVLFGQTMFARASAVVATSQQEAEELASGGVSHEKIVLRRNGVDRPAKWPERGGFRKAQGISENARVVLFLGRLSSKKSPELLLEAFAAIRKASRQDDWQLVFAGPDEGGMQARLMVRAAQIRITGSVHFSGPVFGDGKWAAYRDADVFVLPSQNENFGNAAAESAIAGTPVVVTDQCGIAPLLADVAGLAVPYDAGAIAGAIRRAIGDRELRARLLQGCETVAARLSWDEPIQEMEALYNSLANRKGGSAKS